MFRALQHRLRDSTWTVVFKSLITVHLMIREGSPDATLAYLSRHRQLLAISNFSDGTFVKPSGMDMTSMAMDIANGVFIKFKRKAETFGIIQIT